MSHMEFVHMKRSKVDLSTDEFINFHFIIGQMKKKTKLHKILSPNQNI